MMKYIVVGAFQFVGFHLCKELLDQGNEVVGIDLGMDDNSGFDDKYMEIGRNGNFSFCSIEEWNSAWNEDEIVNVYISYYDFYKAPGHGTDKIIEALNSINKKCECSSNETVLLGPLERADEMGLLSCQNESCKTILLPTIYGPWQPAQMAFQACIQGYDQMKMAEILSHEYQKDAIYIDDLIKELPSIHTSAEERRLVLSSTAENHWIQCARIILPDPEIDFFRDKEDDEIAFSGIYKIPALTSPEDGIRKQIEHYKILQQIVNLKLP